MSDGDMDNDLLQKYIAERMNFDVDSDATDVARGLTAIMAQHQKQLDDLANLLGSLNVEIKDLQAASDANTKMLRGNEQYDYPGVLVAVAELGKQIASQSTVLESIDQALRALTANAAASEAQVERIVDTIAGIDSRIEQIDSRIDRIRSVLSVVVVVLLFLIAWYVDLDALLRVLG
jgi:archaellum component FlaC